MFVHNCNKCIDHFVGCLVYNFATSRWIQLIIHNPVSLRFILKNMFWLTKILSLYSILFSARTECAIDLTIITKPKLNSECKMGCCFVIVLWLVHSFVIDLFCLSVRQASVRAESLTGSSSRAQISANRRNELSIAGTSWRRLRQVNKLCLFYCRLINVQR